MKFRFVTTSVAMAAATLLLASCGGGGGGDSASAGSLQLSGTAATGAALAGADVQVKCAGGSGTATTTTAGGYSVSISGGQLPCIIKVSGTSNGVAVSLHSVAESGTSSNGNTSATANVTPVTEMIVAQLLAAMPNDAFANFNPSQVTQAAVASAATVILDALKTAGVDLSGIDPLKATLVPATGSTAGNAYDQLLDKLGDTVGPESLPLVVNQIATSATTNSTSGLTNAMAAVSGGALAGCPVALSGKYRTIDYTGGTQVHTVDFKAMTLTSEGGSAESIVAGSQACEFTVNSTKVVIGPNGAGAYQDAETIGYIFPVQSHTVSAVAAGWNFLESGLNESNQGEHFFGKFTINADGTVAVCEYNAMNGPTNFGECVPETETVTMAAATDGGFDLKYGSDTARVWGFRGPNGALNLFGTSNALGDSSPTAFRTHFLLTKAGPVSLPAVGEVTKYWDLDVNFATGSLTASSRSDSNTVTAVDAAAGTFTRERLSDSRIDTFRINYPLEGLRFRAQSTGISSIYQLQIPSLGMAAAIDNMPGHFYSVSVRRP